LWNLIERGIKKTNSDFLKSRFGFMERSKSPSDKERHNLNSACRGGHKLMVKRENNRKSTVTKEIIQTQSEPENEPFLSNEELLTKMKISTENTLNHLDKLIQSSSKTGNKRIFLELFRALIEENARNSEYLIYLFEYVIDLRASILLLQAEFEKTKGKTTKDVKKVKTKLDKLLNSPAMVEIGKILQNIQKISQEKNNRPNENPAIEYLR
jgi:hypothetical protein